MTVVNVDFEGVESGGGGSRVHIPEGDYGLKIVKSQVKKGKDSGQPYILFSFKVTKGDAKGVGKTLTDNCSLTKNALWKFRSLLEACGKQVPSKALKIDLDKLNGLECAGTVIDDEPYEDKVKSIITAYFPLADLSEAPATKAGSEEPSEGEEEAGEESGEEEELFS